MRDITNLVDGLFWSFSQCSKPLLDTPMYHCIVTSLVGTLPSLSRVCQPPRTTLLNIASPSALTIYVVVHGGRRGRAREVYAKPQPLAAPLTSSAANAAVTAATTPLYSARIGTAVRPPAVCRSTEVLERSDSRHWATRRDASGAHTAHRGPTTDANDSLLIPKS